MADLIILANCADTVHVKAIIYPILFFLFLTHGEAQQTDLEPEAADTPRILMGSEVKKLPRDGFTEPFDTKKAQAGRVFYLVEENTDYFIAAEIIETPPAPHGATGESKYRYRFKLCKKSVDLMEFGSEDKCHGTPILEDIPQDQFEKLMEAQVSEINKIEERTGYSPFFGSLVVIGGLMGYLRSKTPKLVDFKRKNANSVLLTRIRDQFRCDNRLIGAPLLKAIRYFSTSYGGMLSWSSLSGFLINKGFENSETHLDAQELTSEFENVSAVTEAVKAGDAEGEVDDIKPAAVLVKDLDDLVHILRRNLEQISSQNE